jgi:hypothetical protein
MDRDAAIKQDLEEAVESIVDLGLSDASLTREQLLQYIVGFYGAVIKAVHYSVITPEEAQYLHVWLVDLFEL